jgi:hypothetical protein
LLERCWQAATTGLPIHSGLWKYSRRLRPDDPQQGWKIHVSATLLSAIDIFVRVRPILAKYNVAFKVPVRLKFLAALNSGLGQFSQVGKFITVYARNDTEAVRLAHELHAATRGLSGPKIPFDVRYKHNSLVFYRYGSFASVGTNGAESAVVDPAGRVHPDVRDRANGIPKWAANPFNKQRGKRPKLRISDSIGIDLFPFKALAQRGKGGVYQALDLLASPARFVIVKEGRRHGETDWLGRDGFARIRQESRILRSLCRRGLPVCAPLREFNQHGNRYLVIEKIAGRPLLPRSRIQPAKTSWRRAMRLLRRLDPVLRAIHDAGYVWRDCKPQHIFVCRGKLRLIDFEGACRIADTSPLPWGSHPYLPPIYREQFATRQPGTFEDDYAFGVILFQFLSGEFPPTSGRSRAAIYKRTRCPNHLRSEIERLLKF